VGIYVNDRTARTVAATQTGTREARADTGAGQPVSMADLAAQIVPDVRIKKIDIVPRMTTNQGNDQLVEYTVQITLSIKEKSPRNSNALSWFNIPDYSKYFKIFCLQTTHSGEPWLTELNDSVVNSLRHPIVRTVTGVENVLPNLLQSYIRHIEVEGSRAAAAAPGGPYNGRVLDPLENDTTQQYALDLWPASFHAQLKEVSLYEGLFSQQDTKIGLGNQVTEYALAQEYDVYYKINFKINQFLSGRDSLRNVVNNQVESLPTGLGTNPYGQGLDFSGNAPAIDEDGSINDERSRRGGDPNAPLLSNIIMLESSNSLQNLDHMVWIDFDIFEALRDAGLRADMADANGIAAGPGTLFRNLSSVGRQIQTLRNGDIVPTLRAFYYRDGTPYSGVGPFKPPVPEAEELEQGGALPTDGRTWYEGIWWITPNGAARPVNRPLEVRSVRNSVVSYIKPELWPVHSGTHNYNELLWEIFRFDDKQFHESLSKHGVPGQTRRWSDDEEVLTDSAYEEIFRKIKRDSPGWTEITRFQVEPMYIDRPNPLAGVFPRKRYSGNKITIEIDYMDMMLKRSRFAKLWSILKSDRSGDHSRRKQDIFIGDADNRSISNLLRSLIKIDVYREQIEMVDLSKLPEENISKIKRIPNSKSLIASIYPGENIPQSSTMVSRIESPDPNTATKVLLSRDNSWSNPSFLLDIEDKDLAMLSSVGTYVYSIDLMMFDPMYDSLKNNLQNLKNALYEIERFLSVAYLPTYGMMDGSATNMSAGLGTMARLLPGDGQFQGSVDFTTGLYNEGFPRTGPATALPVDDIATDYATAIATLVDLSKIEESHRSRSMADLKNNILDDIRVNTRNSPRILDMLTKEIRFLIGIYEKLLSSHVDKLEPYEHRDPGAEIGFEKEFLTEPIRLGLDFISSYDDLSAPHEPAAKFLKKRGRDFIELNPDGVFNLADVLIISGILRDDRENLTEQERRTLVALRERIVSEILGEQD
jgi:hypothetical protein